MKAFQQTWVHTTTAVWGIGLLFVLLGMGLAACGYNSVSVGSLSSTTSQAQVAQPLSQMSLKRCGIVHGYGALKLVPQDEGALQAENCFWQAFQRCQPATLVFNTSNMIKALFANTFVRTFTIHKVNGTCLITDVKQVGASLKSLPPATTYTCTGLKHFPRALYMLGCGKDGTIIVLGF